MYRLTKYGEVHQQKKSMKGNNQTGIVILARLSSTRLPGKTLIDINGKKIIQYIIERILQVADINNIVVATSTESSDDLLVDFVSKIGVRVYRGSLNNVSNRFYQAALLQEWNYAIRINGDNIFVDTKLLKHIIDLSNENKFDFISNVKDRTFPKGMSIESVKISHYKLILPNIVVDERYKEHVTLYMYENIISDKYHFIYNNEIPEIAGLQLALDTKDDLSRTEQIIRAFKKEHYNYNLKEICRIIKNRNE